MKGLGASLALCALVCAVCAPAPKAATWRWVDEQGSTHYGDHLPPRYAERAQQRRQPPASRPSRPGQAEAGESKAAAQPSKDRVTESRRRQERSPRDVRLLAIYESEDEIELARLRELKRNDDTFRLATAPLLRSARPEDRRKFAALMDQSRRESERINASFDAVLERYRELAPPDSAARALSPVR